MGNRNGNLLLSERDWRDMTAHLEKEDHELLGSSITSPQRWWIIQKSRPYFLEACRTRTVPCGLMLPAIGETPNRFATKIGGLPAWPAERPWPTIDGKDLRFFCQYNFTEYTHLFPNLPGTILVVFHATEDDISFDFRFHWLSGTESPLVSDLKYASGVDHGWRRGVFHGVMVKTYDIVLQSQSVPAAKKVARKHGIKWPGHTLVLQGWKIGGRAKWTFADDAPEPPKDAVFLCSLGSIVPEVDISFPFVNRTVPYQELFDPWDMGHVLYYMDGFTINFFLHADGSVSSLSRAS